jgi:PAS domain S-box-containing protein
MGHAVARIRQTVQRMHNPAQLNQERPDQAPDATDAGLCYRALFATTTDAVSLLTLDGTLIEVNPRWAELMQMPCAEMVGRHIRDFAAPGHEHENVDLYRRDAKAGASTPRVVPIRRRNGEVIFVEIAHHRLDLAGGSVIMAVGHDVTQSIEAGKRIEQSESNYRSLVENIPDVVWSLTLDLRPRFVGPKIRNFCGFTPEEIVAGGKEFLISRAHPQDRASLAAAFSRCLAGEGPLDVEARCQHKEGNWVWLHYRGAIVKREGQASLEGLVGDVTDRKLLEEQLRQAQKMEAIGRLAGGVAHDFNNLLSVIISYSDMILRELKPGDPLHADISEVREAGRRASELTRQLLMFSRQQVLEPRAINLNNDLADIDKMLRRVVGEDVRFVSTPGADLAARCASTQARSTRSS